MRATLYTHAKPMQWDEVGVIELVDGKAVLPSDMPHLLDVPVRDETGRELTPSDGAAFIEALPDSWGSDYARVVVTA